MSAESLRSWRLMMRYGKLTTDSTSYHVSGAGHLIGHALVEFLETYGYHPDHMVASAWAIDASQARALMRWASQVLGFRITDPIRASEGEPGAAARIVPYIYDIVVN